MPHQAPDSGAKKKGFLNRVPKGNAVKKRGEQDGGVCPAFKKTSTNGYT